MFTVTLFFIERYKNNFEIRLQSDNINAIHPIITDTLCQIQVYKKLI